MIRIRRGAEPSELAEVRKKNLATLRAMRREPTSNDINGYRVVAEHLWRVQHYKCCYCESKVPRSFNDVEHYRPKADADRAPGSSSRHGYWWLAYSWENLLFSCPTCNRSGKNSQFPLALGSKPLTAEEAPPGRERPLLIDPASDMNPLEHIEYLYAQLGGGVSYWWARPRAGSIYGVVTVQVCDLNRSELLELREDYFSTVLSKQVDVLMCAINAGDKVRAEEEYKRSLGLLCASNLYVGLAYDVLRSHIPGGLLKRVLGVDWPEPCDLFS